MMDRLSAFGHTGNLWVWERNLLRGNWGSRSVVCRNGKAEEKPSAGEPGSDTSRAGREKTGCHPELIWRHPVNNIDGYLALCWEYACFTGFFSASECCLLFAVAMTASRSSSFWLVGQFSSFSRWVTADAWTSATRCASSSFPASVFG